MHGDRKTIWQRLIFWRKAPCERYERLLSLYADNMASEKQAKVVEAHIAACPICRAFLATIRVASTVLADKKRETAMPAGLSERLALAIAREREREQAQAPVAARRRVLAPRMALAGALASVILVAALYVHTHQRNPVGPPAQGPAEVASQSSVKQPEPPASISGPVSAQSHNQTAIAALPAPHARTVITHRARPALAPEPVKPANEYVAQGSRSLAPSSAEPVIKPHAVRAQPALVAARPRSAPTGPSSVIRTAPTAHLATPHRLNTPQIAEAPAPAPAPSEPVTSAPPVRNPGIGEQPTSVAEQPQNGDSSQPATTGSPRIQLASRLKLAGSPLYATRVAISQERHVDYSGSLSIVGSSIR